MSKSIVFVTAIPEMQEKKTKFVQLFNGDVVIHIGAFPLRAFFMSDLAAVSHELDIIKAKGKELGEIAPRRLTEMFEFENWDPEPDLTQIAHVYCSVDQYNSIGTAKDFSVESIKQGDEELIDIYAHISPSEKMKGILNDPKASFKFSPRAGMFITSVDSRASGIIGFDLDWGVEEITVQNEKVNWDAK